MVQALVEHLQAYPAATGQMPQVRGGTASHEARPQLTRKNCMRGTASVMPPHTTVAAMAILLSRAIVACVPDSTDSSDDYTGPSWRLCSTAGGAGAQSIASFFHCLFTLCSLLTNGALLLLLFCS